MCDRELLLLYFHSFIVATLYSNKTIDCILISLLFCSSFYVIKHVVFVRVVWFNALNNINLHFGLRFQWKNKIFYARQKKKWKQNKYNSFGFLTKIYELIKKEAQ